MFAGKMKALLLKRWHSAGEICNFAGKMKTLLLKRWHGERPKPVGPPGFAGIDLNRRDTPGYAGIGRDRPE